MQIKYAIKGMHCQSCVNKIQSALSSTFSVNVSLNPPLLTVEAEKQPSLDELNTLISKAGNYQLIQNEPHKEHTNSISSYYPIILIAAYITGVTLINNTYSEGIHWNNWMNQFMAGFFLVFSAFKLLDIRGFADGYATYDLLARRWHNYGFIYPFLELGLGILYLGMWHPKTTYILTIVIMGFSSLGVINSLMKKQTIQCACLGTILKVPLSSVTLIEDLAMVCLAALSLMM